MAAQPNERQWPQPARAEEQPRRPSVLSRIRKIMPHVDEQTGPRATGIFIPSWFLAIILVPVCGGILWVATTLTEIRRDQTNLANTIEYRLKEVETQEKLNNERWLDTKEKLSRLEGAQTQGRR
jgi:hypothetical protein